MPILIRRTNYSLFFNIIIINFGIQQAVFEKFNMCEENVNDLLKWVTSVEQKISSVGGPREKIDELRNQINALKVG